MNALSVGIGCRSGVSAAQIESAVLGALGVPGVHAFESVAVVASVDTKAGEPGLLEFCARHALPVRWFSREQIGSMKVDAPSAATREHLGVDGVCEPCALLASADPATSRLIVRKQIHGDVTVAIAALPASSTQNTPDQDLP
jgi:cobalamin biosynthesis protein CbiG